MPWNRSSVLIAAVFSLISAAQTKPFTEYDGPELLRAVPELAGMQFAASNADLEATAQ